MKTFSLSSVFFLLVVSFSAFGQEKELKPIKRIIINDVFIQVGFNTVQNNDATIEEFKSLAPKSILLKNDQTDFTEYSGFVFNGGPALSVLLGLKFSDKQKTNYKANPMLRVGFSYFSGTNLSGGSYRQDRKPYDTLTSARTGETVYIDSVTSKNYGLAYRSEQIRFDGSLIFRTNPKARWSLYAGIGINAGVSFHANTTVYYSTYGGTETRFSNGKTYSANGNAQSYDSKAEKFTNKNNFNASMSVPMGVDFRIGKKFEFWKRLHLFYEIRPGINVTSIPELQVITNSSLQQGLGLRVSMD